MSLLQVRNLRLEFGPADQPLRPVRGVDIDLGAGELLGIAGESGSGKSLSLLALMGLIDAPGRVFADVLRFDGIDLLALPPRERRRRIGGRMAMIFQDPVASLDPSWSIGFQLVETLRAHRPASRSLLRDRAVELLRSVEIADPAARLAAYPHQLSGGLCQRVMIAMALASEPQLLLADEPTTALDVTIQAQVLELLARLQRERSMAMLLVTHDLSLLAGHADRVAVMYAGEVVESQPLPDLFDQPRHPYTAALLAALPERSRGAARLPALAGQVPGPRERLPGCRFAPRCPRAVAACRAAHPPLVGAPDATGLRCIRPLRYAEALR